MKRRTFIISALSQGGPMKNQSLFDAFHRVVEINYIGYPMNVVALKSHVVFTMGSDTNIVGPCFRMLLGGYER